MIAEANRKPLYGPLSEAEGIAIIEGERERQLLKEANTQCPPENAIAETVSCASTRRAFKIDFERFCETHPYRVVGPEKLPERRFTTLTCAAQTVVSAGLQFHVECGEFKASYMECRSLVQGHEETLQVENARQKAAYWDKIGTKT